MRNISVIVLLVCSAVGCTNSHTDKVDTGQQSDGRLRDIERLTAVIQYRQPHELDGGGGGGGGSEGVMILFLKQLVARIPQLDPDAVMLPNTHVDELSADNMRRVGKDHGFRWGLACEVDVDGEFDGSGAIVHMVHTRCAIFDAEKGEILWKGPALRRNFPSPPSYRELKDKINAMGAKSLEGFPRLSGDAPRS